MLSLLQSTSSSHRTRSTAKRVWLRLSLFVISYLNCLLGFDSVDDENLKFNQIRVCTGVVIFRASYGCRSEIRDAVYRFGPLLLGSLSHKFFLSFPQFYVCQSNSVMFNSRMRRMVVISGKTNWICSKAGRLRFISLN